ncbi:MAG: MarR family transcriptional regulator [Clostridia bacterium]|nr:MarR family transcriptional regulator [Clostridia bacterium]
MDNLTFDPLKLENQLCFPLYAASREVIKLYKPFLDELDLTYTQYIAMILLWEYKSMTVKEMGNYLFLDSGTLTPLLKKLEAKGMITRVRSTKDERNLNVTITADGEALHARALHIPLEMGRYNPLSLDETITLYRLLYKMLGQPDITTPDWAFLKE